jgi:hypothetical protein
MPIANAATANMFGVSVKTPGDGLKLADSIYSDPVTIRFRGGASAASPGSR